MDYYIITAIMKHNSLSGRNRAVDFGAYKKNRAEVRNPQIHKVLQFSTE